MSKEDALEIGFALNSISMLVDRKNLDTVKKYLERISEIVARNIEKEEE